MGNRYKNYPLFAFGGTILLLMVGSGIGVALLWFLGCTCMYCIAYSTTEKNLKDDVKRFQQEIDKKWEEIDKTKKDIRAKVEKEKGGYWYIWNDEYKKYPEVKKLYDELDELIKKREAAKKVLK